MNPIRLLATLTLLCCTPMLTAQMPSSTDTKHQKLAAAVGRWDVAIEMVGKNGKPQQSKGASQMRLLAGGLWLVENFSSTMEGIPFEGHGATGYDPAKGKYVLSWIDSWTPALLLLEGDYDKDGKVLTMTGTGPGADGKPTKYRNVTTWISKDQFTFEMFLTGDDGKEVKALTMTYTRQDLKHPK